MDFWDWQYGAPFGVFGFIIVIVLINAVASVMKTRAKQDVLREAMRNGQEIDPELLKSVQDTSDEDDGGPVAGLILMAVAIGLVFMGYQLGNADVTDEPIFDIMLGVASIPFLIGFVLLIAGLFKSKKK